MCLACHQANAKGMPFAITFENIKDTARTLYPEHHHKLKTGLYSAVNKLKATNKLKLCPGGMELVNP